MDDQGTNRDGGGSVSAIKRHRFRFSLSAILFVIAAISLFLGYAQWRRQSILRQAKELDAHGVRLQLRERWANLIWPEVSEATFVYRYVGKSTLEIGSKTYNVRGDGAKVVLNEREMYDQLDALGVENCEVEINGKKSSERMSVKAHVTNKNN